jgi:hypothetical protein
MLDDLETKGAEFPKMRLRFYESTHRGVHAACNVKLGDTLFFLPTSELITVGWGLETEMGKIMLAAGLTEKLNGHNYLAVYLLEEWDKKKKDPSYVSRSEKYMNILPENVDDFPVCYSDEVLEELNGVELKD